MLRFAGKVMVVENMIFAVVIGLMQKFEAEYFHGRRNENIKK